MSGFVHLHVHSEYSLLDGLAQIDKLFKRAKELGMDALALTDHGVMYGAIDFYQAAKKYEIKPIIGCCLPGQLIYTDRGMVSIEEIRPGDLVLTHTGAFKPVQCTMTRHYEGRIYGVRAANCNVVWLTDEHPVLVTNHQLEEPHWARADSLVGERRTKKGGVDAWNFYVAFPRIRSKRHGLLESLNICDFLDNNIYRAKDSQVYKYGKYNKYDRQILFDIPAVVSVTPKLAKLLGLFVAKGSFQYDKLGRPTTAVFTFGSSEGHLADFVVEVLDSIFGLKSSKWERPPYRNTIDIRCHNTVLARLFFALCGAGCTGKVIPSIVYHFSQPNIRAFLDGLVLGDGKVDPKTGQITLGMASKDVVWGTRLLIASLGFIGKVTEAKEGDKVIYQLTWMPEAAYRRYLKNDEYIFMPLKETVIRDYSGPVYNLKVAEAHSYVTDFALHNCEMYLAPRRMHQRLPQKDKTPYHLILLAKDETGYRNLIQLATKAQLEGFYYKPRIDKELLQKHAQGLIALSGCGKGEIPRLILAGNPERACQMAAWYKETFGESNFYLELQAHDIPEMAAVNEELSKISREADIPLVATNDVHYVNPEDAHAHEILLCIQTNTTINDPKRMRMNGPSFYLKSAEEMSALFPTTPEALENTLRIAEQCDLRLDLEQLHLPSFAVPEGFTPGGYLESLCRQGLAKRYPQISPQIEERLEYELSVIEQMGFISYFLIVWDFVQEAKRRGILVGPGRGSAAGSLVSYCLGITDIDPLAHGLLFERFLSVSTEYWLDGSDFGIT